MARKSSRKLQKVGEVDLNAEMQTGDYSPNFRFRNLKQRKYAETILNNQVTLAIGCPGTAKTLIALYCAVRLLDAGEVDQIYVTRPLIGIGSENSLGALPGELEEKTEPYLGPIKDNLCVFLTPGRTKYMIDKGKIEFLPTEHLRGRSLNNAFLLVEEAQNAVQQTVFTALTRIGDNTRLVVTGDYISQRDLHNKYGMSGLQDAERRLSGLAGVGICRFGPEDIERSGLVKSIMYRYYDGYE